MTTKKDTAPNWMPRQQPLTAKQMKKFLYALMRVGNVTEAARIAKANRTAIYQRKARDEQFATAFEECRRMGVENLTDTAFRLAHEGWQEPVFHDGEECGTKQRISPALIIFLLKSHDPERYRERYDIEHGGKGGGPLALEVIMDPKAIAEAKERARAEEIEAA